MQTKAQPGAKSSSVGVVEGKMGVKREVDQRVRSATTIEGMLDVVEDLAPGRYKS